MHIFFIICIQLLGLGGFLLASYIYRKKKGKKKMICPRKADCDTVIHSDYSKVLGIPVEVLGMLYYFFISMVYPLAFLLNLESLEFIVVVFAMSACAVLFSVYLVSVQAFVIKHWCTWCLISAAISFLILITSYCNGMFLYVWGL